IGPGIPATASRPERAAFSSLGTSAPGRITTAESLRGFPRARPLSGAQHGLSDQRSYGPLTARLVLVDRPDVAVGIPQGEFAPAPVLIAGLARDAQVGPFVDTVLVECIHVWDLNLKVHAHTDTGVGELIGVRLLGMQHHGELANAEDRQAVR